MSNPTPFPPRAVSELPAVIPLFEGTVHIHATVTSKGPATSSTFSRSSDRLRPKVAANPVAGISAVVRPVQRTGPKRAYIRKNHPVAYPPHGLCAALAACAFWHMLHSCQLLHTYYTHAHAQVYKHGHTVLAEEPNLPWLTRSQILMLQCFGGHAAHIMKGWVQDIRWMHWKWKLLQYVYGQNGAMDKVRLRDVK